MVRRPPRSTRTDTLFPYTTLFRSRATCLADLEELPPGVLTCFGSDGRSERRLWTPWSFIGVECRISSERAVAALRESVCSSIAAIGSGFDNIVVGMSGGLDRKSTRLNSSH